MQGELAVALEKGMGGSGACMPHQCLSDETFLFSFLNTSIQNYPNLGTIVPQLGLLSPFLAPEIKNRCGRP